MSERTELLRYVNSLYLKWSDAKGNPETRYAQEFALYAVAEARADEARRCAADVCERCFSTEEWWPANRDPNGIWWHTRAKHSEPGRHNTVLCNACTIHERLHRESEAKSVDK